MDAGKDDEECFMGTEFQFGKLKSSGDELNGGGGCTPV